MIHIPTIVYHGAKRAKFHGSAYFKQRIGAYGGREFHAYIKRISLVSMDLMLVCVCTPHY